MINSKIISNGILRAIGILVAITLLLYFIYLIKNVLIYIIVSIILALIANPLVEFLRRKFKFNNTFAVVTTLSLFVLLFSGIIMLFVPLILDQSDKLSILDTKSIENKSLELYEKLNQYLNSHNIDLNQFFKENDITSKINFNVFTNFFNAILSSISGFGVGFASSLFITFFLLKDKVKFIIGYKRMLPESSEDQILNSVEKINSLLSRYFIGLLIQLTVICILYLIVLLIFGVENAFIIAFLCAILNIVPYVGPLIGSILAGLLTMMSNINNDFQTVTLPTTIYVMIGFFIVQLIDNNISSPIIFSKSVNAHPLEIFLVVLISGTLFGIIGMIIAVPFYTIIKVIAQEFFPENKIVKTLTRNF